MFRIIKILKHNAKLFLILFAVILLCSALFTLAEAGKGSSAAQEARDYELLVLRSNIHSVTLIYTFHFRDAYTEPEDAHTVPYYLLLEQNLSAAIQATVVYIQSDLFMQEMYAALQAYFEDAQMVETNDGSSKYILGYTDFCTNLNVDYTTTRGFFISFCGGKEAMVAHIAQAIDSALVAYMDGLDINYIEMKQASQLYSYSPETAIRIEGMRPVQTSAAKYYTIIAVATIILGVLGSTCIVLLIQYLQKGMIDSSDIDHAAYAQIPVLDISAKSASIIMGAGEVARVLEQATPDKPLLLFCYAKKSSLAHCKGQLQAYCKASGYEADWKSIRFLDARTFGQREIPQLEGTTAGAAILIADIQTKKEQLAACVRFLEGWKIEPKAILFGG